MSAATSLELAGLAPAQSPASTVTASPPSSGAPSAASTGPFPGAPPAPPPSDSAPSSAVFPSDTGYREMLGEEIPTAQDADAEIGFWIKDLPYVWMVNLRETEEIERYRRVYMVVPEQPTYVARLPARRAWPEAALTKEGEYELWPSILDPETTDCSEVVRFFGAAVYAPRRHPNLRVNGKPYNGTYAWFADAPPLSQRDIRDRIYVPPPLRCFRGTGRYIAAVCLVDERHVLSRLEAGRTGAPTAFWLVPQSLAGTRFALRDFGPFRERSVLFAFSIALLESDAFHVSELRAGRFPRARAQLPVSFRLLEEIWVLPAGGDFRRRARALAGALARHNKTVAVRALDRVPERPLRRFCDIPPAALYAMFEN